MGFFFLHLIAKKVIFKKYNQDFMVNWLTPITPLSLLISAFDREISFQNFNNLKGFSNNY